MISYCRTVCLKVHLFWPVHTSAYAAFCGVDRLMACAYSVVQQEGTRAELEAAGVQLLLPKPVFKATCVADMCVAKAVRYCVVLGTHAGRRCFARVGNSPRQTHLTMNEAALGRPNWPYTHHPSKPPVQPPDTSTTGITGALPVITVLIVRTAAYTGFEWSAFHWSCVRSAPVSLTRSQRLHDWMQRPGRARLPIM